MRKTLAERLDSHLDKSAANGCWVWTASTIDGYGQIGIVRNGKLTNNLAHRVAFELATGEAPGDRCVLHRCDNPPCCNPDHLFLGSRDDNAKDMVAKRRQRNGITPGEQHGMSKLTDADVVELRRSYAAREASQPELARRFGIRQSTVWAIIHRRTWAHV